VGDRLGGHFVQGHVDTVAILRERRRQGEWEFLEFDIDPSWTELMVAKGSIAVDGISLTLVEVRDDGFSVMLIPHTLAMTTLGTSARGDRVNIEVDILAKHVRKLMGKC
jgi:riboflavin synthase